MKLSGDRNQCQGCKEYFKSTHAFDKHRRGEIGVDRRCLTPLEMTAKGMFVGSDGFWRGSAMPAAGIAYSAPEWMKDQWDAERIAGGRAA